MAPKRKRPLAGKSTPASGKVILVGVGPSAMNCVGTGVDVFPGLGVLVAVGVFMGVLVATGVGVLVELGGGVLVGV